MSHLENTVARRGGRTASKWYETIEDVTLNTAKEELRINFSMSSKGIGYTDVEVGVKPADFGKILQAMSVVDRQAALEAMSIEITKQLASPASLYREFERKGELGLLKTAQIRYRAKPRGENEQEKMIYHAISDIVHRLDEVG